MAGAAKVAATMDEGTIVALLPDGGWKYLSTGAWTDDIDVVRRTGPADHLLLRPGPWPSLDIVAAVEVLRRGGLVAFPTETVYGLGADAANPEAVGRIFAVKGRPRGHPVIVHLAEAAAIKEWAAEVPPTPGRWPRRSGPGPSRSSCPGPPTCPTPSPAGVRPSASGCPNQPLALELLEAFGGGVAAPSANRFGRVSPTTAAHVRADLGTDVDLILDGGPCAVGVESTIVDLSRGSPRILRLGGLSLGDLSQALGHPVEVAEGSDGSDARSGHAAVALRPGGPGRGRRGRPRWPSGPGRCSAEGRRVGRPRPPADRRPARPASRPCRRRAGAAAYAQCLYQRLREADRRGLDVLLAVPPPEQGIGAAVADRLRRAAATR